MEYFNDWVYALLLSSILKPHLLCNNVEQVYCSYLMRPKSESKFLTQAFPLIARTKMSQIAPHTSTAAKQAPRVQNLSHFSKRLCVNLAV